MYFVSERILQDFIESTAIWPINNVRNNKIKGDINNPVRTEVGFFPLWLSKEWLQETWREMVKLKESGLCKHIGVSNFTAHKLNWLMDSELPPENNQGNFLFFIIVELHPYLPQNKLLKYCKDNS
ncbi:hypothetical protein HZS_7638 [Henneguya salminicola]|nr:hypothetical protein HZS_7638 [Henneguya salminicola]